MEQGPVVMSMPVGYADGDVPEWTTAIPLWMSTDQIDRLRGPLQAEGFKDIQFTTEDEGRGLVISALMTSPKGVSKFTTRCREPVGLPLVIITAKTWKALHHGD